MSDRELQVFFTDVSEAVDDDIRNDGACPDFAAVVALAHQLDPRRVPAAAVDEVAQWAPVVPLLEGRRMRDTRDDPVFHEIVAEVRAAVAQEVIETLAAPAAPAELAKVVPIASRRRAWWIGVGAAAAALVLSIGLLQAIRLQRDDASELPNAASLEPSAPQRGGVTHESETTEKPRRAEPEQTEAEPPADAVEPAPAEEPEANEAARSPKKERRNHRPRRDDAPAAPPAPAPESLEDRLARLDREAHERWKAGDLPGARERFREIVSLAGKRRLADLAYGDLFTLARQAGLAEQETALWREYLKTFPRGRFADDAQAGLCRRSEGEARKACWEDYLQAMPKGSYRRQAQRELDAEVPQP